MFHGGKSPFTVRVSLARSAFFISWSHQVFVIATEPWLTHPVFWSLLSMPSTYNSAGTHQMTVGWIQSHVLRVYVCEYFQHFKSTKIPEHPREGICREVLFYFMPRMELRTLCVLVKHTNPELYLTSLCIFIWKLDMAKLPRLDLNLRPS